MAKFKCVYTNSIYEFTAEHDIKTMRTHPEYVEVIEEIKTEAVDIPVVKKAGRPAKVVTPKETEE